MPAYQFDLVHVYRTEIAAFVVVYALVEVVWLRTRRKREHPSPEVFANLFIYLVDTVIRFATWPARFAVYVLVASLTQHRIATHVFSAIACYLGVDLVLYAWHRVLHETELGWALHSVHHTGREFNVSLGVRVHWLQRAVDDLVYLPLVAVGFDPLLVLAMVAWNRFSQFWVHTEMIGRLSWLDAWLNTPSNHRVHHALAQGGPRANYGSNLMLWDRIFGTYQRNAGSVEYGTDDGELGNNPLTIQLAGMREYVERRLAR